MKIKVLSMAAMLVASGSVLAEPYIGVGVGSTDYGINNFDDPTGLNIYLGSRVSDSLAIEAFYTDFGTAEDEIVNEVDVNISNFGAGILMGASPSPGVNLFVNLGIHAWEGEVTSSFYPHQYDDHGSDIYYGFGGSFEVANGLSLGARYTKYDIDEEDISLATLNLEAIF